MITRALIAFSNAFYILIGLLLIIPLLIIADYLIWLSTGKASKFGTRFYDAYQKNFFIGAKK